MMDLTGGTINVKGWDGDVAITGTDKDLVVYFYAGSRHNPLQSQQQGVPIYDPCDYIRVYHPGEPLNVPERPVIESDKWRFKAQWDAYKANKDQKVQGTPLSVLFPNQPEIIKTLDAMHILTVQQLANLSDTGTQNVMFGLNLKQKAQEYLQVAEKGVQFHQFETERANLQAQIKELTDQVSVLKAQKSEPVPAQPDPAIAALTQIVANLQAQVNTPKRPGRPPKRKQAMQEEHSNG